MPLLNFIKARTQQPELLSIDITRNRSTDSTLDASAPSKKTNDVAVPSPPPTPAKSPSLPWRTKEMSSIVRPSVRETAESQIQEDFWTINRCNAFDEDDEDYDDDDDEYRY